MAASRGGGHGGHLPPPPVGGSAPHLPTQSEEKNGQNQPFSANFWIFAPSESHFAPSMPPTKKFLVPPLCVGPLFGYSFRPALRYGAKVNDPHSALYMHLTSIECMEHNREVNKNKLLGGQFLIILPKNSGK